MFGKKAETEVVEEVEHELRFKEWFNLKGIRHLSPNNKESHCEKFRAFLQFFTTFTRPR